MHASSGTIGLLSRQNPGVMQLNSLLKPFKRKQLFFIVLSNKRDQEEMIVALARVGLLHGDSLKSKTNCLCHNYISYA